MNTVYIYALVSILISSVVSFAGALTLFFRKSKIEKILIYFVSFAAGALFGDAFIHLLPQAVKEVGFTLTISLQVLSGIILSFIFEKFVNWTHCHHLTHKGHAHHRREDRPKSILAAMNLFGDGLHNFIDGLITGASYLVSIPVGIATTIAILLHEIPQELGDFGILIHSGLSTGRALFYNFLVSLTALLGVIIALVLNMYVQGITSFLIPFSAGTFMYIAGSDLIPELHHETKIDRSIIQLAMFVLGISIMISLLFLE